MASMEEQNPSLNDEEIVADPSDFIGAQQRRAQARVMTSLDDNPEQAAQSIELERDTGVPAPVIHGNFENFQKQNKARLASELLRNNQYLAQFADSHPMAPKVAADDWGNLDKVSETLQKGGFVDTVGVGTVPTETGLPSVLGAAAKGFVDNYNFEGQNEERKKLAEAIGGIHDLKDIFLKNGVMMAADALNVTSGFFSGLVGAAAEAGGEGARQLGMSSGDAARLTRDIYGGLMVNLSGAHMFRAPLHPEVAKQFEMVAKVYNAAKPFIDAGEVPPMGVHPEIDKVHIEQSKRDLKAYDEAFKESQASQVRERTPDLYADFIRSHTNSTINVSADAVRRLYGDKPITPEDGILGWAPRLEDQLALADLGGGHVEIPLADWLAKVDPEVNKALHDDIKIRKTGVTKNEAEKLSEIEKVLKDAQEEEPNAAFDVYHGSPHEFDAFSMEKIGTGEGAQSYGHGLYFAENEKVAGDYAKRIIPKEVHEKLAALEKQLDSLPEGNARDAINQEIYDLENDAKNRSGNQYRARIKADKEQFLDHDTALEDQPVGKKFLETIDPEFKSGLEEILESHDQPPLEELTGGELRQLLERYATEDALPGDTSEGGKHQQEASEFLKRSGIPGIKYLDQGSRPLSRTDNLKNAMRALENDRKTLEGMKEAGASAEEIRLMEDQILERAEQLKKHTEPTYNFVLFDESLIEITHKNGQAVEALRKAAALEDLTQFAPKAKPEPGFQPVSIIPDFAEKGGTFGSKALNAPVLASFSYKEALAAINFDHLTGVPKALAEFFGDRLDRLVGDVPVRVVARDDVQRLMADYKEKRQRTADIPAFYDPPIHEIVISDDVANGRHGPQVTAQILLHEGIHAFTSRRIARDPELRGHIQGLMKEFKDFFEDADPTALKQFKYAFENEHEFMAEAMSNPEFQKVLGLTPLSEELAAKLGLGKGKRTVWEAVRDIVKNLIEKLVGIRPSETILDGIFQLGKVFEERGVPPVDTLKNRASRVFREEPKAAGPAEPELPQVGTTRIEDRDPFKGAMPGFTAVQTKRIMSLIERRHAEDVEAATKLALEEQKLRESKEWKDNRLAVKAEVEKEIGDKPVVILDQMLSSGRHSFGKDFLTEEQKAKLPKNYITAKGVDPDEIAGFLGYSSGRDMVDRLSAYTEARKQAGMSAKDYLTRVVDIETDRQMELRYKPKEGLLEEAKDRIASETQLELLHETTLGLATKAGLEFSIDKASFTGAVKHEMGKLSLSEIDPKKYLADAGRSGRAMQEAYTRQDWAEAAKNSQAQYTNMVMYQEALKVAKERGRFDKVAKTMSQREIPSMVPDYTNWVHDILLRVGKPVKRSVQDLQDAIARTEHKNLGEFVEYKEGHDLREMPVADFLHDQAFRKEYGQLTLDEFRAIADSIKTLIKNGKNERTIERAGEAADLAEVKGKMLEQLREFAEKHYDASGKRWLGPIPPAPAKLIRTFIAQHIQIEALLNRWDRGDYKGVFNQYVMRDLADAANNESAIERRYSKMLGAIKDDADLREVIPNQIWRSPDSEGLMTLTRKNLRAMLLNAGNEENLAKLAKGYKVEPEIARAWLHQHATPEDWAWAKKIGDIFAEIKKESDMMYRSLSGVEPESIATPPIQTPHGEMPGWYYPLIKHPFFEGTKRQIGTDPLEGPGYVRATVPAGYTKKRTGATYPLALDLDMMPVQMRQMIHDIAMRPAVINASKIFYDKEVRAAIARHYGDEYRHLLIPYIRDVANAGSFRSDAAKAFTNASEFIRQNAITTLIGLNPGTVMKHGPTALVQSVKEVGLRDFAREMTALLRTEPATGESNWRFAMDESQELQRRTRHYNETLGGAQEKVLGEESMRDTIIKYASAPVAFSDLLSAVPTWNAAYKAEMSRNGGVHGDAVSFADRAVRRAHGSSVITNRAGIMRAGPAISWLTSVYGFFNHIMNRQYEMMWQAKDALQEAKDTGSLGGFTKVAAKQAAPLTAALFAYVLLPALIEELVSPLPEDKNHPEGLAKKAAKGLGFTLSASWIGVRDLASGILYGKDPAVGLFSTLMRTPFEVARDFTKDRPFSKEHAGNIIQHGATMLGMATGMMNSQLGRMGKFGYNYYNGLEHPKGPWQWLVGMRFGTTKGHSQTWAEYVKHLKGGH